MLAYDRYSSLVKEVIQTPDCRPLREKKLSAIAIHHTANVAKDPTAWSKIESGVKSWLTTKDANYVSAHFQINRDGSVIQLCDPRKYEAFHAGVSSAWHSKYRKVLPDWNRYAIGIELVGDGNVIGYTDEQYKSLVLLVDQLMAEFEVSYKDIKGHDEIAWPRKNDPGVLFQWDYFIDELKRINA